MQTASLPISVNYHLNKNCNFRCRGCYAVFNDDPATKGVMLPREQMFAIVDAVAEAPLPAEHKQRKLTFAGGEPTLCRWLPELIAHAKQRGLVTMLVTNGSRCSSSYLQQFQGSLDWLTLSIDSVSHTTNIAIGRHSSTKHTLDRGTCCRILTDAATLNIQTKVNTVVNRCNLDENLTELINRCRVTRWKILQIMSVNGQNDLHYQQLGITRSEFDTYVERQRVHLDSRVTLVPEPNTSIRGSYCMIDPRGRFFDSSKGHHSYSDPILQAGIKEAFSQVCFDTDIFLSRGGDYDFSQKQCELTSRNILSDAINPSIR